MGLRRYGRRYRVPLLAKRSETEAMLVRNFSSSSALLVLTGLQNESHGLFHFFGVALNGCQKFFSNHFTASRIAKYSGIKQVLTGVRT